MWLFRKNVAEAKDFGQNIARNYESIGYWDAVRADGDNDGEIDNRVLGYCHDRRHSPFDRKFSTYHGWTHSRDPDYGKKVIFRSKRKPEPVEIQLFTKNGQRTYSGAVGTYKSLKCASDMLKTCSRASFTMSSERNKDKLKDMGFAGNVSGKDAVQMCADACTINRGQRGYQRVHALKDEKLRFCVPKKV